jgi:hypothetical protein
MVAVIVAPWAIPFMLMARAIGRQGRGTQ